ncbi:MAG: hypothetical protein D6780_02215 [Candidatus Dadabacteria bacterium]|nr:MAG: hypothetical protein D6780_02215 [Candidatus Dadabacteria bacterium]
MKNYLFLLFKRSFYFANTSLSKIVLGAWIALFYQGCAEVGLAVLPTDKPIFSPPKTYIGDLDTALQKRKFSFPEPKGSSLKGVAILFSQNGLLFMDSLATQYSKNIDLAVAQGFLTAKERKLILRRVRRQKKVIDKALLRLLKKAKSSARLADAQAVLSLPISRAKVVRVRFNSSFGPPFRRIPEKNKAVLASLRTVAGQLESFSGLAIAFFQSLTQQIVQVTASSQQSTYVFKLEERIIKSLKRDIRSLVLVERLINVRRFKNANKSKINLSNLSGKYQGTLRNLSSGTSIPVNFEIAFDPNTNTLKVSFNRLALFFGEHLDEFSEVFNKRKLKIKKQIGIWGELTAVASNKGFVRGSLKFSPSVVPLISNMKKIDFYGSVTGKDSSIVLDIRAEFPTFTGGGQAHIILKANKV